MVALGVYSIEEPRKYHQKRLPNYSPSKTHMVFSLGEGRGKIIMMVKMPKSLSKNHVGTPASSNGLEILATKPIP